jgi:hypothetical protein
MGYQEYNAKSPIHGLAAKWATQNANLLSIDSLTEDLWSQKLSIG